MKPRNKVMTLKVTEDELRRFKAHAVKRRAVESFSDLVRTLIEKDIQGGANER